TMALAFSRAMDLSYKRMQFTPDVMPSDITGYTQLSPGGGTGAYVPGCATSIKIFSHSAIYVDSETPTPIGTMHKSTRTFMFQNSFIGGDASIQAYT
ncbi:MAG: AAA family ATPase, partial [Desulfuromonadaceae bacterium]|nr:AAA family ATPase [Desulfuromonadaceae bacterium]